MSVNPGLFASTKDDWGTPPDLYSRLDAEFGFQLDAAAWDWNAKAPVWLTVFDDALSLDWKWVCKEVLDVPPVVWLNPPYGDAIGSFMDKAYFEGSKGVTVVCLVPSRTDTAWWHNTVMHSREIRLIRGRLRFEGAESSAPFPSAIVVFGPGQGKPELRAMSANGQERLF